MAFCTRLATDEDAPAMRPMLRAYQLCLAEYSTGVDMDRELEDEWFEKPEQMYPFIVLDDERPVGIVLVLGRDCSVANGIDADFCVFDMFVTPEARGTGVAEAAVADILGRFPGSWGLNVLTENGPANRFWKRVLEEHGTGLKIDGTHDEVIQYRFTRSG